MSGYQDLKSDASPKRWVEEKEQLSSEALIIEGHPVMERWETPYMEEFAVQVCRNRGGRIVAASFPPESFDGIFYDTYPLNKNEQHTHQFSRS